MSQCPPGFAIGNLRFRCFLPLLLAALAVSGFCIGLHAQTGAAQQERLDVILKEYEAATRKITTLQADLTHTKTNKMLDLSETTRSRLKMKRPRKLLLDTTEPTPSKKVVNGDVAWIYEPQINQAQKFDIRQEPGQVREINPLELAYKGDLDELKRHYTITLIGEETQEGKRFCSIALKLKDQEAESKYASLILKMEEGQWVPIEIKTSDAEGESEEVYLLRNVTLNGQIADSEFEFKPPAGVEIVEPQKE